MKCDHLEELTVRELIELALLRGVMPSELLAEREPLPVALVPEG